TRGLVKMQLAAAKGKKLYDKRDDAAQRDAQRNMDRAFREHQKQ
ncbi:MAG TPA: SsrA-binding protein, partial [Clostridiales bacterium]|nr:SsrA-binding protein [Clostridiales bacterium]